MGDIEGIVQMISRAYKSEKFFTITGIYKVHLFYDCLNGSILLGSREPVPFNFAIDSNPGHQNHKKNENQMLYKLIKYVLFYIFSYLDDDDHKLVDHIREAVIFSCQILTFQVSAVNNWTNELRYV